ncbi:hypothetical protein H0W91_03445 [Patescibacteria group bacterium]|nr:hypothetical protein [Patescibacteria group bacterium]
MTPEEKELLKKTAALAEESNSILRSIQRSMRLARIMTFIYWIFIIGSAIGAYYLIQPYVDQIIHLYGGAKTGITNFNSFFK